MNNFDKNFHVNFSPLYIAVAVMLGLCVAFDTKADEIEEVIVIAQEVKEVQADPLEDNTLIEAIMPTFTWPAGGYGGFVGFNERGAQTVHTSVYVNGIPANEPGSGWYDFAHDFSAGQDVKIVSGANGVLYGSGSIAGTVLIEENILKGMTFTNASNEGELLRPQYIRFAPVEAFEVSKINVNNFSVRNDNDEVDHYNSLSSRINVDLGDFRIIAKISEYTYDYDNCYNYDFQSSNDCVQDGERYNIAIRNKFITFGRNYNNADYFTNDISNNGTYTHQDQTYSNESYRDYIRVAHHIDLSKNLNIDFGLDGEKLYYKTNSWSNIPNMVEEQVAIEVPAVFYGEGDVDQEIPLWQGFYEPSGEFNTIYVPDGTSTLTESENVYNDENVGIFFQANAKFILEYNFGIRLGNDDQNALRLGIQQGPFYMNVGNSFRKPTLYELYGDNWVDGNAELDPEEGIGVEFGYGAISVFRYEFDQTIDYQPGYSNQVATGNTITELDFEATLDPDTGPGTPCVLDPNWTDDLANQYGLLGCIYKSYSEMTTEYVNATYINTGSYVTQGVRFMNNFGPFKVTVKYTDTEQPRVPAYAFGLSWLQNFNGVDVSVSYAGLFDRDPGPYDFLPEGQEHLEDLQKMDFYLGKDFGNGLNLSFRIENITDEQVEILPGYDSRPRTTFLTLNYDW